MKVALVGAGFMGATHVGVYAQLGVEIAAVCDKNIDAMDLQALQVEGNVATAKTSADLSAVKKYGDYEKMLADGGFDFVDICLPTFLHADFSIKAMNAGFSVFCEKPMALTTDECEKMIAVSQSTGKLLGIGQCLRFWPAYVEMKKIVDSGEYGQAQSAHFSRFSPIPGWSADNWLLDSKKSGGPVLDLHIHDSDMVQWIFGMPHAVHSIGVRQGNEVSLITTEYDYAAMAISSSGGYVVSDSFPFEMNAILTLERAVLVFRQNVLTVYPNGGKAFVPELSEHDGYFGELQDFVNCLKTGRASGVVSLHSAADSVLLCLAERESILCGKQVFLSK